MRIPNDTTLDVKEAFREVIQKINDLNGRWPQAKGARIVGSGSAVTLTGLVTLQQLDNVRLTLERRLTAIEDEIDKLKLDNNLV